MSLFNRHKHNWELIDKTIIPPAVQQTDEIKIKGYGQAVNDLLDSMKEHVVHVFRCECGDVKVVKN